MWLGIILAIAASIFFFSIGKNKASVPRTKESNDTTGSIDAGSNDNRVDNISDEGGSTDGGGDSGGGDGGGGSSD